MTPVLFSKITVEVPNNSLPIRMRLASFRARQRPSIRPTLPGLVPILPAIGAAALVLSRRRDNRHP